MPLRLEIKKRLSTRTERVKSVEFHPVEPWVLSGLYHGHVLIHNWAEQSTIKSIEVSTRPVRCAKFVARKQWIICGSDDTYIRVFNYNSMEKVKEFVAHPDFIRYIAVHPTLPLILSASDDLSVRLWDWDKDWLRLASFEGHSNYVMMCQWNPKDPHIFATASLDRFIKVWGTEASGGTVGGVVTQSNFSLLGHERGVNCIEYSQSGERPYIVSGGDDCTVRVWDYQTKQCVMVLSGHTDKVASAMFHPFLPVIISGSEDKTINIWHAVTYRLEQSLKYDMGRCWAVAANKTRNVVAFGLDEGTVVIKMGTERAIASMQGGKIVMAKGSDIQSANVKLVDDSLFADGERLPLAVKEMGASEIFPQSISHHPNGRFIAVCGDAEYVIYTSQALRNKSYGKAIDIVWSSEGHFAVQDESGKITVFHNFQEHTSFRPSFAVEKLFGGKLIGVKSQDFICFFDWHENRLVRRIDVVPNLVSWNDSGTLVVLACAESLFILRHDSDAVAAAIAGGAAEGDDGIEISFDLLKEVNETIDSGVWVADCFAFTTSRLRLQTYTAGQIETIAFLDRESWLLGYLPETNRFYLIDRELSVVSYKLHLSLIEYQAAICRKDFETASRLLVKIPETLHNRVAKFLEYQGHKEAALEVSKDSDHKFELALSIGRLTQCATIIKEAQAKSQASAQLYRSQWKRLGDAALEEGSFALSLACYKEGKDLNGQLLISSAIGNVDAIKGIAKDAHTAGKGNVAFLSAFLLGDLDLCLNILVETDRLPEAALFAKTYAPMKIGEMTKKWKAQLQARGNETASNSLADPELTPELFPSLSAAKLAEAQGTTAAATKTVSKVESTEQPRMSAALSKSTDKLVESPREEGSGELLQPYAEVDTKQAPGEARDSESEDDGAGVAKSVPSQDAEQSDIGSD